MAHMGRESPPRGHHGRRYSASWPPTPTSARPSAHGVNEGPQLKDHPATAGLCSLSAAYSGALQGGRRSDRSSNHFIPRAPPDGPWPPGALTAPNLLTEPTH